MEREQILRILKDAKSLVENHKCSGMCTAINLNIPIKLTSTCADYNYIRDIIPEFYPEFFGVRGGYMHYWWPVDDIESRIKAFDKLIAIYEKDNNIC